MSGSTAARPSRWSYSELEAEVGDGARANIREVTDYPFCDRVDVEITLTRSAAFPLLFRIPTWSKATRITVNGEVFDRFEPGEFARIARTWKSGDKVQISFPMDVRVESGFQNSAVIERGPLVYSLAIGESWRKLKQAGPTADWEVFPMTPWNYSLAIDWSTPSQSFHVEEKPIPKQPFSFEGAPLVLYARGQRLPEWQIANDSAASVPVSPVGTKLPENEVRLIPYGAAKLRITNFPWHAPGRGTSGLVWRRLGWSG